MPKYTLKDFKSDQEIRWCPGCGDYSVLAALQRTLPLVCEEKGIDKDKIVVVSGIIGLLVRMGARGITFKMAVEPRHVMVMVFQLSLKPHVEVAGAHTVLCHLAHDDFVPRERQTCERLAQALLIGPQIEQGCDDHVAADARRAFEIEGLSHEMVLSGGGMTCR